MQHTQIKVTVNSLDEALQLAKVLGNDIFAGYENCIRGEKQSNANLGVREYYVTDNGTILYTIDYKGEKILNKVSLNKSLNSAPLAVAVMQNGIVTPVPGQLVDKSDHKQRRLVSKAGFFLLDQSLAAELTAQ